MKSPIVFSIVSVATLATAGAIGLEHRDSQKEIRTTTLHVDGIQKDLPSLAAVMRKTEAVVVGQVVSARLSDVTPEAVKGVKDDSGTFVSTAYSLRVTKVITWPTATPRPETIEIELPGLADIDKGPYIQRLKSDDLQPLSVGATYIVFIRQRSLGLRPSGPLVWLPATGDDQSIIEVRGQQLTPRASTKLSSEILRMSLSKLAADINKLAGGKER